jgi:hypothetical protein
VTDQDPNVFQLEQMEAPRNYFGVPYTLSSSLTPRLLAGVGFPGFVMHSTNCANAFGPKVTTPLNARDTLLRVPRFSTTRKLQIPSPIRYQC